MFTSLRPLLRERSRFSESSSPAPASSSVSLLSQSLGTTIVADVQTNPPTNFSLDATHQRPRVLDTDHTYQVAVVCAVSLSAWGIGQGPSAVAASVQVSAQAFLRLVTLGIFELESSAF
jgi:hypothetical protein